MKRFRRNLIPQRRRVFLGCEGESERGYGARIRQLLELQRQDVHLDVVLLRPGGGDPLTLVERAQRRLMNSRRRQEPPYVIRAVLLDADRLGESAERDARMRELAVHENITLIWQNPCHEALLLRHFPDCQALRPPTVAHAMEELRQGIDCNTACGEDRGG